MPARVATALGYASRAEFLADLERRREAVRAAWTASIAGA
jgi:hypothetical protein